MYYLAFMACIVLVNPLMASHHKPRPVKATGTNEPQFNQVQPCVVSSAPDANELSAMVMKVRKLMLACALSFSSGR